MNHLLTKDITIPKRKDFLPFDRPEMSDGDILELSETFRLLSSSGVLPSLSILQCAVKMWKMWSGELHMWCKNGEFDTWLAQPTCFRT